MGVASTGVRGREEDAYELRRAWTGGAVGLTMSMAVLMLHNCA